MKSQIAPIRRAIKIVGTAKSLAEMIGCHPNTVRRWTAPIHLTTHHACSPEKAILIEIATHGEVDREDILPHLYK